MRKGSTTLCLLTAGALCLPGTALAAPHVTLKARAVPVPKHLAKKHSPNWPHTGNILGRPAAVEAKFHISGNEFPSATEYPGLPEYGYAPPPLREVTVYLPKGTKIHAKGFPVCSVSHFQRQDPEGCPKGSLASPPGQARGVVSFGTTHVHENVKVQAYFAPGGGLTFYIEGRSPAAIETFAAGKMTNAKGAFSKRLTTQVPLIETVTGAPAASAEYIDVKVGAIVKKHGRLISYGTVPPRCPKGGFPVKAQLRFGSGAASSTWSSVGVKAKAPCPKGSGKHHDGRHHKHHHG